MQLYYFVFLRIRLVDETDLVLVLNRHWNSKKPRTNIEICGFYFDLFPTNDAWLLRLFRRVVFILPLDTYVRFKFNSRTWFASLCRNRWTPRIYYYYTHCQTIFIGTSWKFTTVVTVINGPINSHIKVDTCVIFHQRWLTQISRQTLKRYFLFVFK